jgi:prophage regulatory protein
VNKPARILRLPAVKDRTGLATSTIYKLIRAGKFPRHIKITERASGWLETDIDAWVESRARKGEAEQGEGTLLRRSAGRKTRTPRRPRNPRDGK